MPETITPLVLGLTGVVLLLAWYVIGDKLRGRPPLPPGPRGLPIIGNMLDMPKDYEWLHWSKHKDLYGTPKVLNLCRLS